MPGFTDWLPLSLLEDVTQDPRVRVPIFITTAYPPYHIRFRFDPAILARATPRKRRLMGDHKRSNYG